MNRQVYLDHNASTPVHPEVVEAMLPYFSERFGNPSSVHGFGREAREGLETARDQVAHFLRVGKEEVVFEGTPMLPTDPVEPRMQTRCGRLDPCVQECSSGRAAHAGASDGGGRLRR